jgi:hypothetical protein
MSIALRIAAVPTLIAAAAGCARHYVDAGRYSPGPAYRADPYALLPDRGPTPHVRTYNKNVDLLRGIYRGDLVVEGNDNDVEGDGHRTTIVDGNVVLLGNNNEIFDLSITGRVIDRGRNNDVDGVRSVRLHGSARPAGTRALPPPPDAPSTEPVPVPDPTPTPTTPARPPTPTPARPDKPDLPDLPDVRPPGK